MSARDELLSAMDGLEESTPRCIRPQLDDKNCSCVLFSVKYSRD